MFLCLPVSLHIYFCISKNSLMMVLLITNSNFMWKADTYISIVRKEMCYYDTFPFNICLLCEVNSPCQINRHSNLLTCFPAIGISLQKIHEVCFPVLQDKIRCLSHIFSCFYFYGIIFISIQSSYKEINLSLLINTESWS